MVSLANVGVLNFRSELFSRIKSQNKLHAKLNRFTMYFARSRNCMRLV